MLARSLIREVAPAGMADSASANSAAQAVPSALAEVTLGILCSPLRSSLSDPRHSHDGGPALTMRAPCHALSQAQAVDSVRQVLLNRLPARAAAMAKLPPGGRFCRAVYVPLTTTGRSSGRTRNEAGPGFRFAHPGYLGSQDDAHLRTERHQSWRSGGGRPANQFDRLCAAGCGIDA